MKSLRHCTALAMSIVMIITLFAPAASSYAEGEEQGNVPAVDEQQPASEEEPASDEQQPAEDDAETSGAESNKTEEEEAPLDISELVLKVKAEPVNPSTKVYKNGRLGRFAIIFSGKWLLKSEDVPPADDEEEVSEEEEQEEIVTEGQKLYEKLLADGWTFKYDLQDIDGDVIAEDIDINEGYKYVIPKKKSEVRLVAFANKAGETERVFETDYTEKIRWSKVPKNVKASSRKSSNNVKVTWDKVKNASGYYVYRIASKKRKPKRPVIYLSADKGCEYVDKNLPGKKTYYYYVKSVYLDEVAGEPYHTSSGFSEPDTATVQKYLRINIRPIGWHTTIKGDATLFDGKTGGASHGTIRSGLKVEVTEKYPAKFEYGKHPSRIYILYKKGNKVVKQGWIGYSHAKGGVFGTVAYKKKKALDWTKERKEAFVNGRGFTSPTKYLIWVSTYTQRVNIFKGRKGHWKLYKSNRCVTGTFLHSTKIGDNFGIWKHQKTRVRYFYQSTSQYYYHNLSFFSKGNSFHTVCWRVGSNRQVNFIKKTLQPGTRGCCRMYTPDATWIYNNIPMKTRVVVR